MMNKAGKLKKYLKLIVIVLVYSRSNLVECDDQKSYTNVICGKLVNEDWIAIGNILACIDSSSSDITKPNTKIIEINGVGGSHLNETIKKNISALEFVGRKIKFIPRKLKTELPGLKAFSCEKCGIVSIEKDDLEQFGNDLELLWLPNNLLSSLMSNLFVFNQNLKLINIAGNPLKYIEPEFFDNLKYIKHIESLNMTKCGCVDENFHFTPDTKSIQWNDSKCNDLSVKFENVLAKITESQKVGNESRFLAEKITNIEKALASTRNIQKKQFKLVLQDMEKNMNDTKNELKLEKEEKMGYWKFVKELEQKNLMILKKIEEQSKQMEKLEHNWEIIDETFNAD